MEPLTSNRCFRVSQTEQLTQTEKLVDNILGRAINRLEGPEVGRYLGGKEKQTFVARCAGGDGVDKLIDRKTSILLNKTDLAVSESKLLNFSCLFLLR